jgi:hypothetical protein
VNISAAHARSFFDEATSLGVALWPVTLGLAIVAAWAVFALWRSAALRSWPAITLLASSVVAFAGWFLLGVLFWVDSPGETSPSNVAMALVDGLSVAYLVALVAVVAASRGRRLALSALAAFLACLNVGPMIVSSMAVSAAWM